MKMLQSLKIAAGVASLFFALGVTAQTMSRDSSSTDPSASSESVGQHINDGTITAKAKAELMGAKDVKASRVHVKTHRGVVWLTGTVPSAAEKQRAQEIVEGIDGVRSVKNRLKVVGAGE
ncbi:MAG: hyperosmotically inducible periplasmic protein [Paraburkholderia sp.]|nr:hyperosmotically inducible periplasmic protein [Paraburkholderia sp.]